MAFSYWSSVHELHEFALFLFHQIVRYTLQTQSYKYFECVHLVIIFQISHHQHGSQTRFALMKRNALNRILKRLVYLTIGNQ